MTNLIFRMKIDSVFTKLAKFVLLKYLMYYISRYLPIFSARV